MPFKFTYLIILHQLLLLVNYNHTYLKIKFQVLFWIKYIIK